MACTKILEPFPLILSCVGMKSGFPAFFVAQCAVVVPFVNADADAIPTECGFGQDTFTFEICDNYPLGQARAQHSGHPWARTKYSGVRHAAACATVADEILARIAGNQDGSWTDPQNGGQYSLLNSCIFELDKEYNGNTTIIKAQRSSSLFTDEIDFIMIDGGRRGQPEDFFCDIVACSTGQDTSAEDFSRNYCNVHNLMCGSDEGCKSVLDDALTEDLREKGSLLSCPSDCNGQATDFHPLCDCWCPNRGFFGSCSHDGGPTADSKMCIASLESVV